MHAGHMKLTHVPYKGAAPSVTDLIAGQIDGVVDNPPTVLAHIKAGSIRALAVAGIAIVFSSGLYVLHRERLKTRAGGTADDAP